MTLGADGFSRERKPVRGLADINGAHREGGAQVWRWLGGGRPAAPRSLRNGPRPMRAFICLRITNPDDQAYVRSLVPESEGDLVSVLAGLGRGEALVLGEAVPLPTRLQFDKPNPTPNSDDVDFYAKWRDGPTDFDVDAIVKRWRSQER